MDKVDPRGHGQGTPTPHSLTDSATMKTHIDAAAEKLRYSKHSFYRFVNPVTIGTATAASIYPVTLNVARQFKFPLPLGDRWLAVSQSFGVVPARVYFLVVGFSLGYGLAKGFGWLRTELLQILFRYQGWTNARSLATKVRIHVSCGWLAATARGSNPGRVGIIENLRGGDEYPVPDQSTRETNTSTWL